MRRPLSVGRIVFLSLLSMSLGAATIGFVAVFGIQSFRQDFDRIVAVNLPQATVATRLNAEVSGLTSLVGLLLAANSEIALGTIRIQAGDQIDAINRQKDLLRGFELRNGEYAHVDQSLNSLVSNFNAFTSLKVRRLRAEKALRALETDLRARVEATPGNEAVLLWYLDLDAATRQNQVERSEIELEKLGPEWQDLGQNIVGQRRALLEIETRAQGRLTQHTQLSERLTDATRFMASRLTSDATARSAAIQSLIQRNLYFILFCFLVFAPIGAFIYTYLDRNVVGRIQDLTRKMNDYEGGKSPKASSSNEIAQIETSFANMAEAITEREARLVALNETATDARREAEKANRSKSTLLAAASHDLRQPIHAMGLLIGGIDRKGLPDASRETVEHLADLTQETVRLFNSVLDLSKLEAGTFVAKLEPIKPAAILARLEADLRPRALSAGARLKFLPPQEGAYVSADEDALCRILSNLIVNAIDYADEGDISVSVEEDSDLLTLIVSDTGPGFELDGDHTQSGSVSESQNYGLGLSISFALARAMQTELSMSTPDGGGARFALPLRKSRPSKKPTRDNSSNARAFEPLVGLKVVLLEDDSDVNSAMSDGLRRLGCHLTSCRTSREALSAIESQQTPFVLITDHDLGRGISADGLIADAVDRAPNLISTIITTATPGKAADHWRGAETVQILEKPFEISRLASLLRHFATRSCDRKKP